MTFLSSTDWIKTVKIRYHSLAEIINISTRYTIDQIFFILNELPCIPFMDSCLEFGAKKTKTLSIRKSSNVTLPCKINGEVLEQVDQFTYLGFCINSNLDTNLDIRSKTEQARSASNRLRRLLFISDCLSAMFVHICLQKR